MKDLRLRDGARAEFLHETEYDESKREGPGKRFREAVNASMMLIRRFPAGGAAGPAGTRKKKVKGVPFTIEYRGEPAEIVVFAIAADRQQPGDWQSRASGG